MLAVALYRFERFSTLSGDGRSCAKRPAGVDQKRPLRLGAVDSSVGRKATRRGQPVAFGPPAKSAGLLDQREIFSQARRIPGLFRRQVEAVVDAAASAARCPHGRRGLVSGYRRPANKGGLR
jgi:hypothetical protein